MTRAPLTPTSSSSYRMVAGTLRAMIRLKMVGSVPPSAAARCALPTSPSCPPAAQRQRWRHTGMSRRAWGGDRALRPRGHVRGARWGLGVGRRESVSGPHAWAQAAVRQDARQEALPHSWTSHGGQRGHRRGSPRSIPCRPAPLRCPRLRPRGSRAPCPPAPTCPARARATQTRANPRASTAAIARSGTAPPPPPRAPIGSHPVTPAP